MSRIDAPARRQAREAALQMLYQAEIGRMSASDAVRAYWASRTPEDGEALAEPLQAFATTLVHGTMNRVAEIDALLASHAQNWRVERMAVIDRIVLRLAILELLIEPDTPAKVVINEALELARTFSGEEAVAFVNGVLDAIRKAIGRE